MVAIFFMNPVVLHRLLKCHSVSIVEQSYSEVHSLGHYVPMVAHIDRFLDLFFTLTIIFQKVQAGHFYILQVFN